MNQNKQSGFVKWLLITISVLFLLVMLVLPLLVVITQAFKSGVAAYLKAVTDKYTVRALLLTLEADTHRCGCKYHIRTFCGMDDYKV